MDSTWSIHHQGCRGCVECYASESDTEVDLGSVSAGRSGVAPPSPAKSAVDPNLSTSSAKFAVDRNQFMSAVKSVVSPNRSPSPIKCAGGANRSLSSQSGISREAHHYSTDDEFAGSSYSGENMGKEEAQTSKPDDSKSSLWLKPDTSDRAGLSATATAYAPSQASSKGQEKASSSHELSEGTVSSKLVGNPQAVSSLVHPGSSPSPTSDRGGAASASGSPGLSPAPAAFEAQKFICPWPCLGPLSPDRISLASPVPPPTINSSASECPACNDSDSDSDSEDKFEMYFFWPLLKEVRDKKKAEKMDAKRQRLMGTMSDRDS